MLMCCAVVLPMLGLASAFVVGNSNASIFSSPSVLHKERLPALCFDLQCINKLELECMHSTTRIIGTATV